MSSSHFSHNSLYVSNPQKRSFSWYPGWLIARSVKKPHCNTASSQICLQTYWVLVFSGLHIRTSRALRPGGSQCPCEPYNTGGWQCPAHTQSHSLKSTFKGPDDIYIKVDGRQAQKGLSCWMFLFHYYLMWLENINYHYQYLKFCNPWLFVINLIHAKIERPYGYQ